MKKKTVYTQTLTVSPKVDEKPKSVILQPTGKKLNFKYKNTRIELQIPPVEVHAIIEIVPD